MRNRIKNMLARCGSGDDLSRLSALGFGAPMASRFNADDGDGGGGGGGEGEGNPTGTGDDTGDGSGEGDDDGSDAKPTTVPKEQYDRVMAETKKRKQQLAELQGQLDEVKGRLPADDDWKAFQKFVAEREELEQEKKIKKGQYETLLKEEKDRHTKAEETWNTERASLQTMVEEYAVDGQLLAIIPMYTSAKPTDVAALIRPFLTFDFEDRTIGINFNGEHPLNETGEEMTLEQFVAKFIGERDYLATAKPAAGSGGRSQINGKGPKGRLTGEQLQSMGDAARRDLMAKARRGDPEALKALQTG
jgi:hypothetical protein